MCFWNDGNRNKPILKSIEVNECVSIWKFTSTFDSFDSIEFQFIRNNNVFASHLISFFSQAQKHSTIIVLQNMCISIRCMLLFLSCVLFFFFTFTESVCIVVVIVLNAKSPYKLKSIHGLMLGFLSIAAAIAAACVATCLFYLLYVHKHKQYTYWKSDA